MKRQIIKGEIPFVRILIPFIFGISSGLIFPWNESFASLFIPVLILLLFLQIAINIWYKKFSFYRFKWAGGIIFNLLMVISGLFITINKNDLFSNKHFGKEKTEALLVTVTSEPKFNKGILRFQVNVAGGYHDHRYKRLTGNLLIALKTDSLQKHLDYGDELLIPSKFNEVDPPFNPNEFDYKRYLANQQVYHQTFINQSDIKVVATNRENPIVSYAINLRKEMVEKFSVYIHDPDAFAVASTLILGYRADLSRDVLDIYSKTGTMHVLSVSGMHVGIVYIVLAFFLKFMDRNKTLRMIRALLIVFLIWAYAILTGFSPSICRSALMLSFLVLGKAIKKQSNSYNILAASALLLLIYNPYFLVDAGFQLSYLAVFGLVYFYPKIYHVAYIKNWFANEVWKAISLSTAAQLATFPLSIFYFHQFPVYFLLSNLFILIPVALMMYVGLAAALIPWDIIVRPLAWLLEKLIIFTNKGLYIIENIPGANYDKLWIPAWYYLLIYLFIGLLIFSFNYKSKRMLYAAFGILFVFSTFHAYSGIVRMKQRKLIFYSLRKNTAFGELDGDRAMIASDLNPLDKTFSFSVKPSLDASVASASVIRIQQNYLSLSGHRILIWNKAFNYRQFTRKLDADIVLLQSNPAVNITQLLANVKFKLLLIDGTNSDYKIEEWKREAAEIGCNFYILKKNKAYEIAL